MIDAGTDGLLWLLFCGVRNDDAATQEGVSLEAEIDGAPMVFPLGPDLYLSWANCTARTSKGSDQTTVYRCELKPGYRF